MNEKEEYLWIPLLINIHARAHTQCIGYIGFKPMKSNMHSVL